MDLAKERRIKFYLSNISKLLIIAMLVFKLFDFIVPSHNNSNISETEELEEISENLESVLTYVQKQKSELVFRQEAISSLKSENKELEKIVDVNREALIGILEEHEAKTRSNKWYDRLLGAALGMIGSVIITLFFKFIDIGKMKKEESS